ncbi:hypothetical protein [Haliscomenobacter sp.]|uniref:hypothetical protein n=1 Tax=Haliscomenobacter sp. TaxID=2717303 RepID=UPI0035945341
MVYFIFLCSTIAYLGLRIAQNFLDYYDADSSIKSSFRNKDNLINFTVLASKKPNWVIANPKFRWHRLATEVLLFLLMPLMAASGFFSILQTYFNYIYTVNPETTIAEIEHMIDTIKHHTSPLHFLNGLGMYASLFILLLGLMFPLVRRVKIGRKFSQVRKFVFSTYYVLCVFSFFTFFSEQELLRQEDLSTKLEANIKKTKDRYKGLARKAAAVAAEEIANQMLFEPVVMKLIRQEEIIEEEKKENGYPYETASWRAVEVFNGFLEDLLEKQNWQKRLNLKEIGGGYDPSQKGKDLDDLIPYWEPDGPDPKPNKPSTLAAKPPHTTEDSPKKDQPDPKINGPRGPTDPPVQGNVSTAKPVKTASTTPVVNTDEVKYFTTANWSEAGADRIEANIKEQEAKVVKNRSTTTSKNKSIYVSGVKKITSAIVFNLFEAVKEIALESPVFSAVADAVYIKAVGPSISNYVKSMADEKFDQAATYLKKASREVKKDFEQKVTQSDAIQDLMLEMRSADDKMTNAKNTLTSELQRIEQELAKETVIASESSQTPEVFDFPYAPGQQNKLAVYSRNSNLLEMSHVDEFTTRIKMEFPNLSNTELGNFKKTLIRNHEQLERIKLLFDAEEVNTQPSCGCPKL